MRQIRESKKQLKAKRENQVAESWFESYLARGKMVSSAKAHEVKLEKDGFYKYLVSVNISEEGEYKFEYYEKADEVNKILH